MGIGAYVMRKYNEYFYKGVEMPYLERPPMEELYTRVGDKICFGCKEYQLCKPQVDQSGKQANLLYCQKCEIFYTDKQYTVLSKNFKE